MCHQIMVSFVLVSHNRFEALKRAIDCLRSCHNADQAEIIVVDNASEDGSREYLLELAQTTPCLTVIVLDDNLGVSAGLNAGYRRACGEYIISLDDDSYVESAIIQKSLAAFANYQDAGIITYRIQHCITKELQNPHGNTVCEVGNFHGAGYSFRRDLLEKIGYLEECLFWGAEELEFSIRVHIFGLKVYYIPDIVVEHDNYIREKNIQLFRNKYWHYGFSFVLHKYLPIHTAELFVFRLFFRDIIFGLLLGLTQWREYLAAIIDGRRDGLQQHITIPMETLKFLTDPNIQPNHGNMPLSSRLWNRFH